MGEPVVMRIAHICIREIGQHTDSGNDLFHNQQQAITWPSDNSQMDP